MNKTSVYILCGESGAYEDITHWVEGVYLCREDAEYRLDQLITLTNKAAGGRDIGSLEWTKFKKVLDTIKNDPLGDPNCCLYYGEDRYTIIESTINTIDRGV